MALATFVLPVAVADAESMGAAVQKIEAALDMPLLLRAVRSQSMPLVSPWPSCMQALYSAITPINRDEEPMQSRFPSDCPALSCHVRNLAGVTLHLVSKQAGCVSAYAFCMLLMT